MERSRAETARAGDRQLPRAHLSVSQSRAGTVGDAAGRAGARGSQRTGEALSLLADFPKKYPSSPLVADAQFWSGWIKTTSGTDPSVGVAELEAFVAAHPNHPQTATARRLIPQALARSSDKADQLKAYKALMEQSPPAAEALYSAAEVAGRLDRPRDREAAWKRLSTDFPDHPLTLKLALDFGSAAFKQKSWKSAATYATQATKSDDGAVRSEAWLLLGESELKQKRYAEAAKAFETVGTVSEVETGVRFRALAGLGLAREDPGRPRSRPTRQSRPAVPTRRCGTGRASAPARSRRACPIPPRVSRRRAAGRSLGRTERSPPRRRTAGREASARPGSRLVRTRRRRVAAPARAAAA